jgi:hypothetical protein
MPRYFFDLTNGAYAIRALSDFCFGITSERLGG